MTNVSQTQTRARNLQIYMTISAEIKPIWSIIKNGPEQNTQALLNLTSIINPTQKRGKCNGLGREHKVLQIRGVIASNEWGNRWQEPVLSALGAA